MDWNIYFWDLGYAKLILNYLAQFFFVYKNMTMKLKKKLIVLSQNFQKG